jgi:GNAT superfamily N-acetyltransferase
MPDEARNPRGAVVPPAVTKARLRVRRASTTDTDLVRSILREAAEWLRSRGMPLWLESELAPHEIADHVEQGLYFIGEVEGGPAGTLRYQLDDPDFWPDVAPGESAFVHRLAIRRRYADMGVSSGLLGWAAERTRGLGRPHLRLDCDASRPRLRAFYERHGFRHHSDRQVGPFFVARYELSVADFRKPADE